MARPGLVWGGRSLDDLVARVSAMPDALNGSVEKITGDNLDKASSKLKTIVSTRGVHNHVVNNSGRIGETRAFVNSVSSKLGYTKGGGRVSGQFGYLKNAPKYAGFQEYGTENSDGSERVKALMGLSETFQEFKTNMSNDLSNKISLTLKQGRYAG